MSNPALVLAILRTLIASSSSSLASLACQPTVQTRTYKKAERFLKNKAIPYATVQVEQPESDLLSRPTPLVDVLNSINRDTHFVLLTSDDPPTVRIVSRLEEEVRKLAEKEKKKKGSANVAGAKGPAKEIQFKWVTSEGDFEHKIAKLREDLGKGGGAKVNVMFMRTPKVRSPPRILMADKLDEVFKKVETVAVEWRPREYSMGNATMFLRSTVAKKGGSTMEELEELARQKLGARRSIEKHAQDTKQSEEL